MLIFSVFDWNYPLWVNLVQKIKLVNLNWNLVPRLIQICRFQWWCLFFLFETRSTLFGKIWSKKWNLSFQAEIWYNEKFGYVEFHGGVHFFCFGLETPFLGKFGPKNENCQFKLKFGTKTNLNKQNSMVVFTFSVLDWKHPLWTNSFQKIRIASLNWNFVRANIFIIFETLGRFTKFSFYHK